MQKKVNWADTISTATQKSKSAVGTAVESAISSSLEAILQSMPQQSDVDIDAIMESVDNRIEDAMVKVDYRIDDAIKLVSSRTPQVSRVEVITPDKRVVDVGVCHKNFEKLVKMVGARLNVALIGEAGSGKTHGAQQCADAIGLPHYTISFHAKMTSTDLRGYMDAVGKYNASPLYTALKDGGVLILDEFDRANTEVVVSLNNLLAGDNYLFPNGENVSKHANFIAIACQNTSGSGASKQYAAASRQDASTLNRFVKLEWNTDEGLERAVAGDTEVTRKVQKIRANAREMGMDIVISPRQSIHANTLMSIGFSEDDALQYSIFECLADDQVKRLKQAI